jgi:hypothetical protein
MAGIEGLKAANALVSQMITVSAGLLAFTVTFVEKFTPKDTAISVPWSLKVCWVLLAVNILFGFWTLMATTGTLNQIDKGMAESNPERTNIRVPAMPMVISFLFAIGFLIAAGWTISSR